jgi:3-hydroxymyristoyl/3-hydroxydecanoyl-(acyl carrier protein) dehydratase
VIVLPEIRATERSEHGVRLQLNVPADLLYFDGHFPEVPLLPGVVQITWAIELARKHLRAIGTFKALSAVKFTRVIQPGSIVWLTLEYTQAKGQLDFAYELDGRPCSNGSALFDA